MTPTQQSKLISAVIKMREYQIKFNKAHPGSNERKEYFDSKNIWEAETDRLLHELKTPTQTRLL